MNSAFFHGQGIGKQGEFRSSGLFEFNTPVKIVPPTFGSISEDKRQIEIGDPARFHWPFDEPHVGFQRRTSSFFPVALNTRGYDIFPGFGPTPGYRNHMIESEILTAKGIATILARIVVTGIYIGARKFYFVFGSDLNVLEQTQNGGETNGKSNTVNFAGIFFNDFHFSGKEKRYGALPADDLERLIRSIE
jgi:hypothetical protein